MSFLGPQERTMLLESLRPPEDYQLDVAIGTTYSLDLIALMVAPVGFTFFDVDPNDPEFFRQDPLEVLEAIRRHAAQMVLFYEAGRIAVPRHYRPLLTYLEDRIVPVTPPVHRRSFHPKVWFVRYANAKGEVWYRLLCLSRNLTFDRCWDTVLILDGYLRIDRAVGFGANRELPPFISALLQMAIGPVKSSIRAQISRIEREIGRVAWDLDSCPFELVRFWPLGYDGAKRWPFKGRVDRMAVISPFLGATTLGRLSATSDNHVLISRRECLDRISNTTLEKYDACYEFSDRISGAEAEDPESLPSIDTPLRGLHAKLYVADAGRDTRIWTGSANATLSAFEGNVEFLVELAGKRSVLGIGALLEKVKGSTSFVDLLQPYQRPDTVIGDPEQEALERELDELRMPIASAEWILKVTSADAELWVPVVSTSRKLPIWGQHITITFRLASMADASAQLLAPDAIVSAVLAPTAFESLTSFIIIEIEGYTADAQHHIRFMVNAELLGAPANRRDRLLRHMLQDKQSVLRFLLLLLADTSDPLPSTDNGQSGNWGRSANAPADSSALLEPLLRALDRSPARLNAIQSLLTELGSTDEGRALVPDGLLQLFDAIWQAKEAAER